jgi:hypothetical protein
MTISTEPIFAGSRFVQMKFYFAPRNPGDPTTVIGTITLMPGEDNIVLDAIVGQPGPPGPPSPFWLPQWASTITDPADLPTGLGTADAGQAWYISGFWHIWTGTGFATILGSIPGPPGPTPDFHISAHGVEVPLGGPYGPLDVAVSGTSEEPFLDFGVPLIPGPPGPTATILTASDFDNTVPITDGQVPMWDATAERFKGGDVERGIVGYVTLPESSFGPAGTYSSTWQQIGTIIVAARTTDWYPKIEGHGVWQRSGTMNNAQIEFQVRALPQGSTNSPETGDLCARALFDPSTLDAATVANMIPHFSDTANPSRAVGPSSSVGRIPAGQITVFNILIWKAGGTGSYVYTTPGSHLSLEMIPAED